MTKQFRMLVIFTIVLVAGGVYAQPRPNVFDGGNRWLITAYDDSAPNHAEWATQSICFLPFAAAGTHVQGVWYSTSFPNWRGRYSQEGDRVLMHGDYAAGVGHDGMVIELFAGTSPKDEGAGQWTEWRETGNYGTTIGWVNARLRRVGKCDWPTGFDGTKASRAEMERVASELATKVKARPRADGKPAESPMDRGQPPIQ